MSDSSTPLLTRDAMRAAIITAPTITFLDSTALGGRVGIKQLTGRELDELYAWGNRLQKTATAKRKPGAPKPRIGFRALVLVRTLVTEQGARLLEDADRDWLDELPSSTLKPIIVEALRYNGITDAPKDDEDEDEPDDAESSDGAA